MIFFFLWWLGRFSPAGSRLPFFPHCCCCCCCHHHPIRPVGGRSCSGASPTPGHHAVAAAAATTTRSGLLAEEAVRAPALPQVMLLPLLPANGRLLFDKISTDWRPNKCRHPHFAPPFAHWSLRRSLPPPPQICFCGFLLEALCWDCLFHRRSTKCFAFLASR